MNDAIERFVNALNEAWREDDRWFTYQTGDKYAKIVAVNPASRSAYAFVVLSDGDKFKAGDILKPASWAAPARNKARGHISDPAAFIARHSRYGMGA